MLLTYGEFFSLKIARFWEVVPVLLRPVLHPNQHHHHTGTLLNSI
ncbi:MAG: hypothetical protein CM15mV149_170 [uncultured marine virus]|nr:MAG: hypothetical protein CM15mV149_170 [uncultured marine virus]